MAGTAPRVLGDSLVAVAEEEPAALILLIRHCSHMKQQEARLRLVTLLLLLALTALVLLTGRAQPGPWGEVGYRSSR